jgi:hypothetical protein
VTYPAYPDTTVALRARDKYKRGDDRRGPKIAPGKPSGAPKSADEELWTRYDNLKKEM